MLPSIHASNFLPELYQILNTILINSVSNINLLVECVMEGNRYRSLAPSMHIASGFTQTDLEKHFNERIENFEAQSVNYKNKDFKRHDLRYFKLISNLEYNLGLDISTLLKNWELHEYRTYEQLSRCLVIFRHSVEHPYLDNKLKSVDFVIYNGNASIKTVLECKFISLPKCTARKSILRYINQAIIDFNRPFTKYVLNDAFYQLLFDYGKLESHFIRIRDIQFLLRQDRKDRISQKHNADPSAGYHSR